MVALETLLHAPGTKLLAAAAVANEVRGTFTLVGGLADMHNRGFRLDQLWLVPLILIPPLVIWIVRRGVARRRIARRLAL